MSNDAGTEAELADFFEALWRSYVAITPQAERIHALLRERGETVVNDHVAFRTYDLEPIHMDRLAKAFTVMGYEESGRYDFPEKRLDARSYAHPSGRYPHIFVSQLRTGELLREHQSAIQTLVDQVDPGVPPRQLLTDASTWDAPDVATYEQLSETSEYAGWVAAFGLRANHFTVHVNDLTTFEGLEDLNAFLEGQGFALNDAGGTIKGSSEDLLAQSSTWADRIPWRFADGERTIPSCYYEFALRYTDPETGSLYKGFVPKSADRLFESTTRRGG